MEKAVIQYNEARARLMMDIIPPAALRAASRSAFAYNTQISRKREYIRTIFLLFAVSLLTLMAFSAARASTTISYFNDSELAVLNTLQAGILDFIVGDPKSAEIYVTAGDSVGQTITPTMTANIESFTPRYKVKAVVTDPNQALCNALEASAGLPFEYTGLLMGIDTGETDISGVWPIDISLPLGAPGVLDGDICIMKLVYSGWVQGENNEGYTDEEEFTLTIHAVIPAPLQLQSAFSADVQILEIPSGPQVEDGEEGRVLPDEANERGEERSGERGTERERTAEPPAELIVETVDVPPAAETPAVTETLPVPEGEPGV